MKTLVIAEAGVNHNGDMNIARQLIDAAAEAEADMVKFQTFSTERLVVTNAEKAEYQMRNTNHDESQYAMLQRLELTRDMHKSLIEHCNLRKIEFFSTGFDIQSIDLLMEFGLDRFKIPSGEITNLPYLRHIGHYDKPIILSTGMSTMDEIGEAIDALEKAGTHREKITVLQCTTEYPTPFEDVNLQAMLTIRDTFGVETGYSDHTSGIEVAIAAVALGATTIEKHFTLDRNLPGPDHKASLLPDELKAMVAAIRNIEKALGSGIKSPGPGEQKNRSIVRKSLVAACSIRAGELYNESNLAVKRPGTGLSPMRWDEVVGRKAPRDFAVDELIKL